MNKFLQLFKSPALLIGLPVILSVVYFIDYTIEDPYYPLIHSIFAFFVAQFLAHSKFGLHEILKDYVHDNFVVNLLSFNLTIITLLCMFQIPQWYL
jgi:succinate dehydrogenase hydrophobic anchor subunit